MAELSDSGIQISIDKAGNIETSLQLTLRSHKPDPDRPGRYIIQMVACEHRKDLCGISACGKRALFNWRCQLKNVMTTIKECNSCEYKK